LTDLFGVDAGPDAAKADGFAHEKRQGANMRDEHYLIDCRVNRRATDNIQPRLIQ
jgi:hypothetical protein